MSIVGLYGKTTPPVIANGDKIPGYDEYGCPDLKPILTKESTPVVGKPKTLPKTFPSSPVITPAIEPNIQEPIS